jgi:RimJ/RimL family protein N-acetyltransferase
MTEYLGGPESIEKLKDRHNRYLTIDGCYTIEEIGTGTSIGWVGNWEIAKDGEKAWETGFSVLPEYQGKGIATEATILLLQKMKIDPMFRYIYAFPDINNKPSNAVCRKAGFSLVGEEKGEYPPGNIIICNNWRYDLTKSES